MATIAASTTNTQCHPNESIIKLPMVGASSGDAPSISTSKEIILELSCTGKKSRTIAMAATAATQPVSAWKNLNSNSALIELKAIHAKEASI